MTHTRRCAESVSLPCNCECGGAEHGAAGARVYRQIRASFIDLDESGDLGQLPRGPGQTNITASRRDAAVDAAVDVLVELYRRSPESIDEIHAAVCDVLRGEIKLLMPPLPPGRKKLGRKHWICQILAECAATLDEVADLPAAIGQMTAEACLAAGWGSLRSKATGEIVERLLQVTVAPSLDPFSTLAMKVRIAALMFCPQPDKHPELEHFCGQDLAESLDLST